MLKTLQRSTQLMSAKTRYSTCSIWPLTSEQRRRKETVPVGIIKTSLWYCVIVVFSIRCQTLVTLIGGGSQSVKALLPYMMAHLIVFVSVERSSQRSVCFMFLDLQKLKLQSTLCECGRAESWARCLTSVVCSKEYWQIKLWLNVWSDWQSCRLILWLMPILDAWLDKLKMSPWALGTFFRING